MQFSQESFHELNTQVAQLTSQLAQDTYEEKLELGALAEKLAFTQQTIYQLEDQLQTLFSTQVKAELETTIADSVGWLRRSGQLLSSSKLQESLVGLKKYATEIANGALTNKESQPYTFEGADVQLPSKKSGEPEELNEDITYLMRFAVAQGWVTSAIPTTIANTTFWSEGARAYAQLMLENQSHLTPENIVGLKSLETEGLTLEKAQSPWSEPSGKGPTGNEVLDKALEKFVQAASKPGVEGKRSVTEVLEEGAIKTFENSLKAVNNGKAGNPTKIDLWGGINQTFNLTLVEEQKYPALTFSNHSLPLNAMGLNLLPRAIVNGVRMGFIGPKGSGDEIEAVLEGEAPFGIQKCTNLKLYFSHNPVAGYEGPCAFEGQPSQQETFEEALNSLVGYYLQAEAYRGGLQELEKEGDPAVKRLAGARALVQGYFKVGLPQAVSSDPTLESDIEGTNAQFLDPEPGTPRALPEELAALTSNWISSRQQLLLTPLKEQEAALKDNLIGDIATRSKAWATQIEEQVKPYIEGKAQEFVEHQGEKCESESCGKVNEQSPIIESTINRIQLTRDVLKESSPPGAETLAPTAINTTEATLNGDVQPNGGEIESCQFEYGASEPHGHTIECTPPPTSTEKPALVSAKVSWPTAGGSFHERLVVKTWGGTTYGEDVKVQLAQSAESGHGPVLASTPTPGVTIELKIEEPPPAHPGLPSPTTTPVGMLSLLITHVPTENRSVPLRIQLPTGEAPTALYMLAHIAGGAEEYKEVPAADYTITGNVITVTLTDGSSDDLDGETNGTIEAGLVPLTAGATATTPSVTTTGAAPGFRLATLEGTVNPNGKSTNCHFTWTELEAGIPTNNTGIVPCAAGPGSGNEPIAVTALATELSPATEYQFTLTATNTTGTATSLPNTFTTSSIPGPTVTTGEVTNIKKRSGAAPRHRQPQRHRSRQMLGHGARKWKEKGENWALPALKPSAPATPPSRSS